MPLRCYVLEEGPGSNLLQVASHINDVTSYLVPGHKFIARYRGYSWDGRVRLYSRGSFPTGLLPGVLAMLKEKKVEVRLDNQLPKSDEALSVDHITPDLVSGITLRDYQLEAIQAAVNPEPVPPHRGIIWFPSRSVKTDVAAALVNAFHFPSTIFVVHQKILLHQTIERFSERLGVKVGVIGDKKVNIQPITVAMIQTLVKHLNRFKKVLDEFNLVIFDEVHHLSSTTWYK